MTVWTPTDDGFADHVVVIANPSDEPRRAVVTVLTGVGTLLEDNPRLDVRLVAQRQRAAASGLRRLGGRL